MDLDIPSTMLNSALSDTTSPCAVKVRVFVGEVLTER